MIRYYLLFGIWICLVQLYQSKIMCKSENNTDLDWYILIKYPHVFNFFYLSSASNGVKWELPNYSLDSDKNMVAITLRQAYNARNDDNFYVFYNDEKPKNLTGSSGGHLKGVVNFDKETGYWLVHSVPKFPPSNAYGYGDPQHIYGQSFICVSLRTTSLKNITNQLLMMYSSVYSYNLPNSFSDDPSLNYKLAQLVNNMHRPGDKSDIFSFTTVNNVPLIHFGKGKEFDNDIYASLMAPVLKSTLYVESWRNGNGGRTPSDCKSNYKVYNIKKVKIRDYSFEESDDHSKWAVTTSKETHGTCIGDINRMNSQFERGGGSLCILQTNIWNAFLAAVVDYEKCE